MSDEKLDLILQKLDKIDDRQDIVEKTLIRHEMLHERNTLSLEEHIRRTELLETKLDSVELDIEPIKRHVVKVNAVIAVLGVLGAIILGLNELGILKKLF